eukprot:scaffold87028_cov61-Phaeocystis_antarctica.AAC.2
MRRDSTLLPTPVCAASPAARALRVAPAGSGTEDSAPPLPRPPRHAAAAACASWRSRHPTPPHPHSSLPRHPPRAAARAAAGAADRGVRAATGHASARCHRLHSGEVAVKRVVRRRSEVCTQEGGDVVPVHRAVADCDAATLGRATKGGGGRVGRRCRLAADERLGSVGDQRLDTRRGERRDVETRDLTAGDGGQVGGG